MAATSNRHYLTCQDDNCQVACCVGRREFEWKIARLEKELEQLKKLKGVQNEKENASSDIQRR